MNRLLKIVPQGMHYLDSTYMYASDLDNTKYMLCFPHESIDETKIYLSQIEKEWNKENPSYFIFAILFDGNHIGSVWIYINKVSEQGELGWILNKKYWGHGYAFEAAKQIIDFSVEFLNIKHFVAHCDSENIASYKTMEKLGMKRVLTSKNRKNRSSSLSRTEYKYELRV